LNPSHLFLGDYAMILSNNAALLCAICVSVYWSIVMVKAVLITPKIGKAPNVIPKEALGLLSRLIMLPLILCWILYPWYTAFMFTPAYPILAGLGSLMCIAALVLTIYCWHYMGSSWRIGIDPKEKNTLITDGPFARIRHPIYALSMLLMLGSWLSVQTLPMFIIFCIHWFIFTLEAYREEQYLCKTHGSVYQAYMAKTCRFLPL
jgi:protein-S-isoprenylcysteine O-methyltransferase Ste14